MPRFREMVSAVEWELCSDSTDSQKIADFASPVVETCSRDLGPGACKDSTNAPCSCVALNSAPNSLPPGWSGRFGQPRTPTRILPRTIRASEIAYCCPRRKPLVPSRGSRVQNLSEEVMARPRSIQSQTQESVAEGRIFRTSAVICSRRRASALVSDSESSSATMGS